MNYIGSQVLEKVDAKSDEFMSNLPNKAQCEELLISISTSALKAIEQETENLKKD